MILVDARPADDGDCLLVEWDHGRNRHRMLIDGGRTLPALSARHFDLIVCTHLDRDHIGGLLTLLHDPPAGFAAEDIWFNGRRHLPDPDRSISDGEALTGLLGRFRWNAAFNRGPVVVPPYGPLPLVELPGLRLTLLSPTLDKLARLAAKWRDSYTPDPSIANGSSIAFVAEHTDGSRVLFGADAHAEVLVDSLRRIQRSGPYRIDLCKVSHHGSRHNTSRDLLAALDCRHWLFSTDGRRGQPHQDTVELIRGRPGARLWFNYGPGRAGLRLAVGPGAVREQRDLQ